MSYLHPLCFPIPILQDNYAWLIQTDAKHATVVDPGEAGPVAEVIQQRGLTLTHILITHHHTDHTGGIPALKARFGAKVLGPRTDSHRLPPMDQGLDDGDQFPLGLWTAEVLATPGHTTGHLVYRVSDALFTGDTLFSLGCGRLFEGSAETMWDSLKKLRDLYNVEKVFPAHEYTLRNLDFALFLEPDSPSLKQFREKILALTDQNLPTLPTTMAVEKQLNPFLRADDMAFAKHLELHGKKPVEVFAYLRELRNHH